MELALPIGASAPAAKRRRTSAGGFLRGHGGDPGKKSALVVAGDAGGPPPGSLRALAQAAESGQSVGGGQGQRQQPPPPPPRQATGHREGRFKVECVLGKGTFGVVYRAREVTTNVQVAIKVVKQAMAGVMVEDRVLRLLRGEPNVVGLLGTFTTGEALDRQLHFVLEYVPDTLQRIIKHHRHIGAWMDVYYVRLYMLQLFHGLASLERHRVVHRDIKPANLLVEPSMFELKICDFGTAKISGAQDEDCHIYVCSRYYRAPELILSARIYGVAVDMWSAGCVLAEMLTGQPMFPGKDGVDQFAQMIDILGTPTAADVRAMNPWFSPSATFGAASVPPRNLGEALGRKVAPEVIDLLAAMLRYDPAARPRPGEASTAAFFDPLLRPGARA